VLLAVSALLFGLLALALAGPIPEGQEVRDASKEAYERGLRVFGQKVQEEEEEALREARFVKPKVLSQYTEKMTALGGGKPSLVEQYRHHKYFPQAPSFIPVKFPKTVDGKFNAQQSAEIFRPQRPYQFSTDRLRIP